MNDLEIKTLEGILDEVALTAPANRADAIRKLREDVLAIKLTARAPISKPTYWQNSQFWYFVLIAVSIAASLLGFEIPLAQLLGGH